MHIELRKYSAFPDMDKIMQNPQKDEFDFISLAFEIAVSHDGKKENIIQCVGYLLIDFYQGEKRISFEMPTRDNKTDSFYCFKEERITVKKVQRKKFYIENDTSDIYLKREPVLTTGTGLTELLKGFVENDILPLVCSIKPFLEKNHIIFDKVDYEDFIQEYSQALKDFFVLENVPHYQEVAAKMLFDNLNLKIENSPRPLVKRKI